MDLNEIRNEIDQIDGQLIRLFLKRMECSKAVAAYKTQNGLPVLNTQREKEILDNVAQKSGEMADEAKLLFQTMMTVSKVSQYPMVTQNHPLRQTVQKAFETPFAPKKIGCPGTLGSYSEEAAKTLFPASELCYYPSFEDVCQALKNKKVDAAVLPVENSYAGSVSENYDALLKYHLYINAAFNLPVSHCLVACKGTDRSQIRKVYSHEQALNQCKDYIDQNGYEKEEMINTSYAAKFVAGKADPTLAAIASRQTAQLYDLVILDENIQSSKNNSTRFIAVSNTMAVQDDADLISIAFRLPHQPGALYNVLCKLYCLGVNITKIESRPDKNTPFEYVFYLDLKGDLKNDKILGVLCGLQEELPMFEIFGSYCLK